MGHRPLLALAVQTLVRSAVDHVVEQGWAGAGSGQAGQWHLDVGKPVVCGCSLPDLCAAASAVLLGSSKVRGSPHCALQALAAADSDQSARRMRVGVFAAAAALGVAVLMQGVLLPVAAQEGRIHTPAVKAQNEHTCVSIDCTPNATGFTHD